MSSQSKTRGPGSVARALILATSVALILAASGSVNAAIPANGQPPGDPSSNNRSYDWEAMLSRQVEVEPLHNAGSFRCDFDDMRTATVIDSVTHDERGFGTARLVGNIGANDILVVLGRQMISFIELAGNGVNTITVYAWSSEDSGFFAVYSRHTVTLAPTPSLQLGSCAVLD